MILHLPQNTPEWLAHRAAVMPDGLPCVGGSDLWRILGMETFATERPAASTTRIGHVLEPLILLRLAQILDLAPFLPDRCVVDDAHPWMRGSLDGIAPDESLIADAKAVLLGSAHHWQRAFSGDPLDGLPAHIRYQMLWYVGIVGVPCIVAALMIPDYALDPAIDPALAAQLYELRLYRLDPITHADEIAELRATVSHLRATGRIAPYSASQPTPPTRGPILTGGASEGRLLARLAEFIERRDRADLGVTEARAAVSALIPPHARGISAGGRTAIRNTRGSIRLT